MTLNKDLISEIITVTSKAAISCHKFIGKNDKKNADKELEFASKMLSIKSSQKNKDISA